MYDTTKAAAAQERYCEAQETPCFAPSDGICYRCASNIYAPVRGLYDGLGGYSVEYAGNHLITACPHCGYSFVE